MADNQKFRILSLDGGGVRGYLSARLLENIEKHLNEKEGDVKPLGERFDLLVGTSTGAIIAGLLAIGKSAKEIEELYARDIPTIFGQQMKRNKLASLIWSKYKPDTLKIKAEEYFSNLEFKDVNTDLIVTSVDLMNMKPRLYKSDFSDENLHRVDEKLANAIIASASAPVYFPVARNLKYSDYLIDGGLVANNPSMVGIVDALKFTRKSKRNSNPPNGLNEIMLLSIGTGYQQKIPFDIKPLLNAGGMDWLIQFPLGKYGLSTPLVEVLMSTQSKMAENHARTLLDVSGGSYRRINPKIISNMRLDDADRIQELKNISDLESEDIQWITDNMIGDK